MRLHYNPGCMHEGLRVTPLRLLYATGQYRDALREALRLDALSLQPRERLVVNIHEVVIKLAMRRVRYAQAKGRLAELAEHAATYGDENFVAELAGRRIKIATHFADYDTAEWLTNHFFDVIDRTVITESHWRIAQGGGALYVKGPGAAIPFFLTSVMHLREVKRPCLRESACRYLAYCLDKLGDKPTAVAALRDIGLPASLQPQEGEIPLSELLVVQLW